MLLLGAWNSLFPINDGKGTLYYEYLNIDKGNQITSYSDNDIGGENMPDTEEYITIDLEEFDEMIINAFEENENEQINTLNNEEEES